MKDSSRIYYLLRDMDPNGDLPFSLVEKTRNYEGVISASSGNTVILTFVRHNGFLAAARYEGNHCSLYNPLTGEKLR